MKTHWPRSTPAPPGRRPPGAGAQGRASSIWLDGNRHAHAAVPGMPGGPGDASVEPAGSQPQQREGMACLSMRFWCHSKSGPMPIFTRQWMHWLPGSVRH